MKRSGGDGDLVFLWTKAWSNQSTWQWPSTEAAELKWEGSILD